MVVGAFRSDAVARDPMMRRRIAELSRLSTVERIALEDSIAARSPCT